MKILIYGLGAIGQRHLRIIKRINPQAELSTIRKTNHNLLIEDDLTARTVNKLSEELGVVEFTSDEQVIRYAPTHVIDCRIPSEHLKFPSEIIKESTKFLIEKPLTSYPITSLKENHLLKQKNVEVFVGYHLLQHPLLMKLSSLITEKNITSYQINYKEYLPSMQPFRNYKTMHESSGDFSGGIEYSFSHALHLPFFLFKTSPQIVSSQRDFNDDLSISTASSSEFILNHKFSSEKEFLGSFRLSFNSHMPVHNICINTYESSFFLDFDSSRLNIYKDHGLRDSYDCNITKIDMLTLQMAVFLGIATPLNLREYKSSPLCSIGSAIKVCNLCDNLISKAS